MMNLDDSRKLILALIVGLYMAHRGMNSSFSCPRRLLHAGCYLQGVAHKRQCLSVSVSVCQCLSVSVSVWRIQDAKTCYA
jgi:hypothetical protein